MPYELFCRSMDTAASKRDMGRIRTLGHIPHARALKSFGV